jgi:hypothetical protein
LPRTGTNDLWHADHVLAKIAEHLVGPAGDLMACYTAGPPEEEHGAALLRRGEGVGAPACEAVDRRVGRHLHELELRDRPADVVERDWCAPADLREHLGKQLPVPIGLVQTPQHFAPDVLAVAGDVKPGRLHPLGGRDECLGREQVRRVRQRTARGFRELEAGAVVETDRRTARGSASSTSASDRTPLCP